MQLVIRENHRLPGTLLPFVAVSDRDGTQWNFFPTGENIAARAEEKKTVLFLITAAANAFKDQLAVTYFSFIR